MVSLPVSRPPEQPTIQEPLDSVLALNTKILKSTTVLGTKAIEELELPLWNIFHQTLTTKKIL